MITILRSLIHPSLVACFGMALCAHAASGTDVFTGTNPPDTGQDHTFSVGAGTNGLAVEVANTGSEYSHVLLKAGGAATNTVFDWASRFDGGASNTIYLERPELQTGSYGLRVFTPATSAAHEYTATVTADPVGLRSASKPVSKPAAGVITGTLNPGGWHYFRVDLPENFPGWRLALTSTGAGDPDLFIGQNFVPTNFVANWSSTDDETDTIVLTDAQTPSGSYYVGVFLEDAEAGPCNYTLTLSQGYYTQLTWDPGATHAGTEVLQSTSQPGSGGNYYFRITTQNTTVGAWRTALNVTSGNADLYIGHSYLPTTSTYHYRSIRSGSDGFVLQENYHFSANQDWFILVRASAGAVWNLVTGEAFVLDLGDLATDASSGSGAVLVGAEGARFFKTNVLANTKAWRLWLGGLNEDIVVRKGALPIASTNSYDFAQARQMLLVPPYLTSGVHFVAVSDDPGTTIDLDSRVQPITELAFGANTSLSVTGYGYQTYHVDVPIEQIAWEVQTTATSGNPNVAIRRNDVPNEFHNDAFSEAPGSATDSVTLSPPSLSDGSFYITVYGTANYAFTLTNGNPVITDIDFTSTTLNTQTAKAGWRFFRVADIEQQLGSLGWDLFLTSQPLGTELAIRRNAVPSRWNYRNGSTQVFSAGHVDASGPTGFLQRQGHQADIWYVGVYQPDEPLGAFTLHSGPLTAALTNFDGSVVARSNIPEGKWDYFRVDVPAGPLGWDLRITDVTGGSPQLVVRRDLLPQSFNWHFNWPFNSTMWPTGQEWAADREWTGWSSPTGEWEGNRILQMGMNRPLEPGTYYVGVRSDSGAASYTLHSRGIGSGYTIPVGSLDFLDGTANITGLAPRELAYYAVTIPENTASWQLQLTPTTGEAMLSVLKGALPNVGAMWNSDATSDSWGGVKMQKPGKERYVLLPAGDTDFIPAGTYYVAVVSEGVNPNDGNDGRIGTGNIDATLHSIGPLPVTGLGTVVGGGTITHAASLEGAQVQAFQFTVDPSVHWLEVRLENRTGNPVGTLLVGSRLPTTHVYSPYGLDGGNGGTFFGTAGSHPLSLINVAPGTYSVVLRAEPTASGFEDATCTLRIEGKAPVDAAFDGSMTAVSNQETGTWRFFKIVVPADALGWDLRLRNVTGGSPRMVVQRDTMPVDVVTQPTSGWPNYVPWFFYTTWQSGYSYAAGAGWAGWQYSATGEYEYGRDLAMGMNRPLQPGTYYVGVYNYQSNGMDVPASYTLHSRGIGGSYTIPVQSLDFDGAPVNITGLAPREAAYFAVTVPADTPSWQVKLTPTTGESMLHVAKDALPAVFAPSHHEAGAHFGGVAVQKTGKEHYVLLPDTFGESDYIPAGTYYLAVVSEGDAPNVGGNGRIGTGNIAATLENSTPLGVANLGTVSDTLEILHTGGTIEGGDVRAYEFTVAPGLERLEFRFENRVGEPGFISVAGTRLPGYNGAYGFDGGAHSFSGFWSFSGDGPATFYNPTAGTYRAIIQAGFDSSPGSYPDAAFDLRITGFAPPLPPTVTDVAFESSTVVTAQATNAWRYFRLTVPEEALGWDVRVTGVTSGNPQMVVMRDTLPTSLSTHPVYFNFGPWYYAGGLWESGYSWAVEADWTGWQYSPSGEYEAGRVLAVGMNRPLQPGTYYIGILNNDGTNPAAYTLLSRGIGTGYTIPVQPLTFEGGAASITGLAAREAAYFQVTVPENTPNWRLRLTPTAGETMLAVLQNALPNVALVASAAPNSYPSFYQGGGFRVQRAGTEYYTLLPLHDQDFIPAGTYYLAVVSEGVGPTGSQIGTGNSSATLESSSGISVAPLGTLNPSGQLVQMDTVSGGHFKAYEFNVGAGVTVLEARLLDAVGNPAAQLAPGTRLPTPISYGINGGQSGTHTIYPSGPLVINSPAVGAYRLTIAAPVNEDSSFTLQIRSVPNIALNFSATQNGNGDSHTHSQQTFAGQKIFYQVEVPAMIEGQPVLGWRLSLDIVQGSVTLYANQTFSQLESGGSLSRSSTGDMIVVPPVLTPGTWYLEVAAGGLADYTVTSSPVLLHRPAWAMPAAGQPHSTPGLPAGSTFGDTGFLPNGDELPGDHGTDLGNGDWHFYAITIPDGNAGLLRNMLEAISGNPDLYLRDGNLPTISAGTYFDRSMSASSATEYANWVPTNGRTEMRLTPGTWYLGVYAAGGTNVRYRLRSSVGNVQTLALEGGSFTNQVLAAGDWRYYQVSIPADAPVQWVPTFSQQVGDVVMHIRDTVPPGDGGYNWASDNKNQGPYPSYDPQGTYPQSTPPLRPGHTYYLGFRANTDATFSVSSATSGGTIGILPEIAFKDGSITTSVPAGGSLLYRIVVPSDATRFKYTSSHDGSIEVRIEQGTLPGLTGNQHYVSSSANIHFPTPSWPWVGGQTYYVRFVNSTGTASPITFTMFGRTALNDDEDNDGLPDWWEVAHWGTTYLHNPGDDFDGDGLTELEELAFGGDPTTSDAPPAVEMEGGYLTITIAKVAGVNYEVQTAGTLQAGQPTSFSASSTTTLIDNATTLKVRDNFATGSAAARFIRVVVSWAP